jgi:hypothetical protein
MTKAYQSDLKLLKRAICIPGKLLPDSTELHWLLNHIVVIMQLYQLTTTILIFNSSLPNKLAASGRRKMEIGSYIWIARNPSCICIKDMKHTHLQPSVTKNLILFRVLHENKNTGEKYFEFFCNYQQIKTREYPFLSYLNLHSAGGTKG